MKPAVPYQHGGDPLGVFRRYGIEPRPYIDFSVNLNPLGPPPVVRAEWDRLFGQVAAYPSANGDGIRAYYAGKYGCDPATVYPGNGASEVIYDVFRTISPNRVLLFTPSYHDYTRAALVNGAELDRLALLPEDKFAFPSESRIDEHLAEADAVIMGHPNNPTGTFLDRGHILSLAKSHSDTWFIIDESFSGFLPSPHEQSLLFDNVLPDNIIVVQSLTKYYALPGLRLGACMATPRVIERLESQAVPWRINAIADAIAPELTECGGYERATAELVTTERARLYCELSSLPGLTVCPSSANFILAQWLNTGNLDILMKMLLENSIVIRDCRNFPGLEDNFLRFAVRCANDNNVLASSLKKALQELA